jgi:hypothetical protein
MGRGWFRWLVEVIGQQGWAGLVGMNEGCLCKFELFATSEAIFCVPRVHLFLISLACTAPWIARGSCRFTFAVTLNTIQRGS